jgi:galactarate dehydratase
VENRYIKINKNDSVAITVNAIPAGTIVMDDVLANQDIPQGHKLALCNIEEGQPIIRYGVTLGYALHSIKKGDWINEHMLELPTPPALDEMQFATNLVTDLPEPPARTFMGYPNKDGKYAGTRNILGIVTTVQCLTGVLNNAVKRI